MTVKKRLIATLLIDRGQVVQTRRFKRTNPVGSAFTAVDFFNGWTVDEIAILEISHVDEHLERFAQIVEELSRRCFVPLSVGGKIRGMPLVHRYIRAGADKVVINTGAVDTPRLIEDIAGSYGRQCAVLSVDAAPDRAMPSGYRVMVDNARRATDLDVLAWIAEGERLGAGEILLNQIERDGDKQGYDLGLLGKAVAATSLPVIAMGGVGRWDHLVEGVGAGASAAAAGNIFHYTEHSTKKAKEFMIAAGVPMRASAFYKVNMPRRPKYVPF